MLVFGLAVEISVGVYSMWPEADQPQHSKGVNESMNDGKEINLDEITNTIKRKAEGSLIYAILGFGLIGLIVWPLSYKRAGQALQMIDEYHVGEKYRSSANSARLIIKVASLIIGGVFALYILFFVILLIIS